MIERLGHVSLWRPPGLAWAASFLLLFGITGLIVQTYRWSQHHVKHPEGDGLRPYVEEMKAVVKKAIGRRGKSKASPETPAPQGAMADLMEKAHAHDVEHADDIAKVKV